MYGQDVLWLSTGSQIQAVDLAARNVISKSMLLILKVCYSPCWLYPG